MGPTPMTGVLIRGETFGHRHTQERWPREDEGRGCSDAGNVKECLPPSDARGEA